MDRGEKLLVLFEDDLHLSFENFPSWKRQEPTITLNTHTYIMQIEIVEVVNSTQKSPNVSQSNQRLAKQLKSLLKQS